MLDQIHCDTDSAKNSAVIVVTDFSKAFDHVDHNILIPKLRESCVLRSIIPWICRFLSEHTQQSVIKMRFLNGGLLIRVFCGAPNWDLLPF